MKKILFSLVVLSLLIGGYSVLAQNNNLPSPGITPDSPFYFLKSWKETIQLFFTFGAENKTKQYLHLADVRLAEYQRMIEKGKTEIAQKTLEKYEKQLNHALEKIEELKKKGKDTKDISQKLENTVSKHIEILEINLQKVPESSKEGIERALETSREGIEKARGRTEEEQKEEMIEIPKETKPEEEKPKATCQNECSPVGLKRCYNIGNFSYQICGDYDSDGCLEWSSTTICPLDTITCQDGICIEQGQKEQKCSDGTLYNQCSTNKPFYCENGNLINKCSTCGCPLGKQCQSSGGCTVSPQVTCQNECSEVGSKRCSDNGYQVCGNYDADECLEWGSITSCPINTFCQNGNCLLQKCSDETPYGQCSTDKPKYCENGNLINKCSICGCPANTVCQDGICIQQEQKCSDGTLYGQCSTSKPKYCDNGNLVDKCNLCGCPPGQNKCLGNGSCSQFSENVDCESKQYKMVFILLVKNPNDATSDRLTKLSWIKNEFSQDFYIATRNLASMDTKDDIYIMTDQPAFNAEVTYPATPEITKKFYETHNDIYDFISIYTAFSTKAYQQHPTVVQNVKGIGLSLYDNSETYGSKGKLKGVNFMGSIDMYSMEKVAINGLLHETGHQWCCYVGDNFARGQGGVKLEIIQQGIHFYGGLYCPYEEGCEVGSSNYWIPNGDGTFRSGSKPWLGMKYHPFQLYFMGLLPNGEYDTKFWIYDAGIPNVEEWNFTSATSYKQVSVNNIVGVEGERECVLP